MARGLPKRPHELFTLPSGSTEGESKPSTTFRHVSVGVRSGGGGGRCRGCPEGIMKYGRKTFSVPFNPQHDVSVVRKCFQWLWAGGWVSRSRAVIGIRLDRHRDCELPGTESPEVRQAEAPERNKNSLGNFKETFPPPS